jgi:type III secretion protein W
MKIGAYNDTPVIPDFIPPLTPKVERVEVPRNPLLDSMEEIGMKFSESVERHSKRIDERHVQTSHAPSRLERIEKLTELYRLLDHPDQPSLEQQARRMQMLLQQQPSMQAMLALTQDDPARTDIVLQQTLRLATASGDEKEIADVQAAIEELRASHGDKIRAGLNTASAIALFSQDADQRKIIRQLYYKAIVGQQPLSNLLESLFERFNEEQFPRVLRTLQRALADDIAAMAPSLPGAALRSMLRGLGASSQLSNMLQICRDLLERLALKNPAGKMTTLQLARRIVRFCGNGFFARDLSTLTEETVGRDQRLQPIFLNGLLSLLQRLPLPVWKDNKTRQNSLRLMLGLMEEMSRHERKTLGLSDGQSKR